MLRASSWRVSEVASKEVIGESAPTARGQALQQDGGLARGAVGRVALVPDTR